MIFLISQSTITTIWIEEGGKEVEDFGIEREKLFIENEMKKMEKKEVNKGSSDKRPVEIKSIKKTSIEKKLSKNKCKSERGDKELTKQKEEKMVKDVVKKVDDKVIMTKKELEDYTHNIAVEASFDMARVYMYSIVHVLYHDFHMDLEKALQANIDIRKCVLSHMGDEEKLQELRDVIKNESGLDFNLK